MALDVNAIMAFQAEPKKEMASESKPTADAVTVAVGVCEIIIDAAKEAGERGLIAGHLYAILMGFGCTLEGFETLMGICVESGRLRKSGHQYFFVK